MTKNLAGLVVFICIICPISNGNSAPLITTEPVSGCYGDQIEVSVFVDVVDQVEDFYFKLHYDPAILEFSDTGTQPPLTDDWAIVWSETSYGEISVTGLTQYTGGTPIPAGTAGVILSLDFTVMCICDEGEMSSFVFSDLDQGFAGFTPIDGEFEYTCPSSLVGHLVAGSSSGYKGQSVVIPVSFFDSPNDVSAFGFNVEYCADMLNYTGYQKGKLMDDWGDGNSDFDVHVPVSGTVIVGGWNLDQHIPAGSSGVIVELTFEITSSGSETCELMLTSLVDDIMFWGTEPGVFESDPPPIPATGPVGLGLLLTLFTAMFLRSKLKS
jgi:hypothetical protein